MMEVCGDAENRLASELMQHELQLEKDVLDPLSQLAEVKQTNKKNLNILNNIDLLTVNLLFSLVPYK